MKAIINSLGGVMIGNDWDKKLSNIWNSDGFNRFMDKVRIFAD